MSDFLHASNPSDILNRITKPNLTEVHSVRFMIDQVMSAPPAADLPGAPTITLGTASTIASAVQTRETRIGGVGSDLDYLNDPAFRYKGGKQGLFTGQTDPNNYVMGVIKPGGATQFARYFLCVEFECGAPEIELKLRNNSAGGTVNMMMKVNGRFTQATSIPMVVASAQPYVAKFTWPAANYKRIEIWLPGDGAAWGGLYTTAGYTIIKPKYPILRRIAVIGDSFVSGTGSAPTGANSLETFVLKLTAMLGADEVVLNGIGATKWAPIGGTADQQVSGFSQGRLDDTLAMNPQVIIFLGSVNDVAQDAALITAAVKEAIAKCVNVPEVYFFSVIQASSTVNNAIKAGCAGTNRKFFDVSNILYGSGNVSATTGNGPNDFWKMADNVHPNALGHSYIAKMLYLAMSQTEYPVAQ